MNDLENLLQQTLDDEASRVVDPDPSGRARLVIEQATPPGRRGPRLVALGLAALLVAGGAFAAKEVAGRQSTAVPTWAGSPSGGTPSDAASASAPSVAATPVLPTPSFAQTTSTDKAVAALPAGSMGQLPWLLTGSPGALSLKLPGVTAALPKGAAAITQLVPTSDGWIVRTQSEDFTGGGPDTAAQVLRVSRDGSVHSLAKAGTNSSVAISPDGSQVAWIQVPDTPGTTSVTLQVRPVTGGSGRSRVVDLVGAVGAGESAQVSAQQAQLDGWTTAGLLVPLSKNGVTTEWQLDPATGAVTAQPQVLRAMQAGADQQVVVRQQGKQQCASIEGTAGGRQLTCQPEVLLQRGLDGAVWVDGTPGPTASEAAHDEQVWVVSPAGTVLTGIRPAWLQPSQFTVEAGRVGSLLVFNDLGGKSAWVRWDVNGGTVERVFVSVG